MITVGYGICLAISVLIIVYMAQKNYVTVDIHYWTMIVLVSVILLGYWLKTRAVTPEGHLLALCFIYLDSTILLAVLLFAMAHSLKMETKNWVKPLVYSITFGHLLLVWLCIDNDLYYKNVEVVITPYGNTVVASAGPLKIIHYIYLVMAALAIVALLIVGYVRRGTYSRRSMNMFSAIIGIGLLTYTVETIFKSRFSFLPYLYVVADIIIAVDYDYIHIHDLSCIISQSYDTTEARGYVAISFKGTFLGCNNKCYEFLPFLTTQIVDEKLQDNEYTRNINKLIEEYENGTNSSIEFNRGEMTCICEIFRFSSRKSGAPMGYLLDIRDATEEKHTLEIMSAYSDTLNEEVAQKTDNIKAIQRKVVMGMANMIENRDSKVGDHVKRTSDTIKIIMAEVQKQGKYNLDDQTAEDIVRAAPMHDLGKLHIDSAILSKPGKLSDEEYEIMKTHSVKSGEMVMILLDGVEEEHFVKLSYNLARYHHERWDGRGYPEGLVGGMIPVEARIMAIADVYDALVSNRCYKDSVDYEKAAEIMLEGMGSQFDPNLKSVFTGCREQLEKYYKTEV